MSNNVGEETACNTGFLLLRRRKMDVSPGGSPRVIDLGVSIAPCGSPRVIDLGVSIAPCISLVVIVQNKLSLQEKCSYQVTCENK